MSEVTARFMAGARITGILSRTDNGHQVQLLTPPPEEGESPPKTEEGLAGLARGRGRLGWWSGDQGVAPSPGS